MADVTPDEHGAPFPTLGEAGLPASPSLSSVIARIRRSLVVQPRPDALETARAAVLPLLYAGGVDIFDLRVLRSEGGWDSERVAYSLELAGAAVPIEVRGVGESLPVPEGRTDVPWQLLCSGPDWILVDHRGDTPATDHISLYDPLFSTILLTLLSARSPLDLGTRLTEAQSLLRTQRYTGLIAKLIARVGAGEARRRIDVSGAGLEETLRKEGLLEADEPFQIDEPIREALRMELNATQFGFVRPAGPLADITLDDVHRHARQVANLKGQLRAQVDGEDVPIRSRSALYFVLANLALQFGREDALPEDDLVLPPELPPENRRSRALGRAGWHLLLDHTEEALNDRTKQLLQTLRLSDRFRASNRNRPYPDGTAD